METTILFLLFAFVCGSPAENRLINDLLRGSTAEERPVASNDEPVVVRLTFSLQQIIDLNERSEQLTVNAWLTYHWSDINLRWQPEEYENITDIRLPNRQIWMPDILLYNSVDNQFDTTYKVNMLVRNDGGVEYIPPAILTISCKLDIFFWPFDEQTCFFKFGSWSHSGSKIDLKPGGFSIAEYMSNGEWILLNVWVEREEKFYGETNEPFQSIRFYLTLRRRTLYYAFNLLMPCSLVMIIVLLGFTLSPFSCEKIGLQISVSLAICIFMTMLAGMTPQTSEAVPLLGLFFQSCMVISVFSTAATVWVQSIHFRFDGSLRMKFWMRYLLLELLPFILLIKQPKRVHNWRSVKATLKQRNFTEDDEVKKEREETEAFADRIESCVQELSKTDRYMAARIITINEIYGCVKILRESHDDAAEEDQNRSEWQFAALVIDRMFLTLVFGLLLITALIFVIKAPYLVA